ncbi:ABC transporter permease, partial [bacterium]|nr:ABC transporter permease [bacterium]
MTLNSSKLDQIHPGEKSTLWRIGKYVLFRLIVLLITVVITVYLTILIANWGGAMDEAVKANIQFSVLMMARGGWLRDATEQEREEIINQTVMEMEEAAGLNEPFMRRSIRWLIKGITFDWGETRARVSQYRSETKDIKLIILESLPRTLLIFGLAYLFLFFISIFLALYITKLYGGWLDKIMISLSPLSAAPAWIFGILLNFFFLKIVCSSFFSGGGFDAWPSEFKFSYIGMLLKQMAIPFVAILISGVFQAVYSWRTIFLIYSNEDYVEMAKAKGLPNWTLNRRYILKPLLPSIITNFALLFIVLWQEVIALEYIFNVDGIGSLLLLNIITIPPNTTLIVAIVVTFAYLLAITVFLLDLIYAFVDPRVKIGGLQRNNHRIQRRDHDRLLVKIKRLFQPSQAGKSSLLEKVQSKELPGSGAKLKTGESMLDEIFRAFWVEEKAQAVRLVDHHTGRKMIVDRLYPELGLAFLFSSDEDQAVKVYLEAFKRTDIHLIVMDPDQPLSPGSINEIQHCLSSSARRIALGRKPHQEKAAWMLRINEAKSAVLWYRELLKPTTYIHAPQINKWKNWNRKFKKKLKTRVKQFSEYPSAIVGLVIITIMIGISFFTVVNVPYDEMIVLWRSSNEAWRKLPRDAAPTWVNIFRRNDLPYTIQLNSRSANTMLNEEIRNTDFVTKTVTPISDDMTEILISYTFEYEYNSFPQDIAAFIDVQYEEKLPLITITLVTPDDREFKIDSFIPNKKSDVYY